MAERIWSGPRLFAKYYGDREAAKRLERKARGFVGYLMDQLRAEQKRIEDSLPRRFKYMRRAMGDDKITGFADRGDVAAMEAEYNRALAGMSMPTYKTGTWHLSDGSRIKAYVWRDVLGERARVEVFAPGGGSEFVVVFFSGGVESGVYRVPTSSTALAGQYSWVIVPTSSQQGDRVPIIGVSESDPFKFEHADSALDLYTRDAQTEETSFKFRDYYSELSSIPFRVGNTDHEDIAVVTMRTRPWELTGKLRLLAQVQFLGRWDYERRSNDTEQRPVHPTTEITTWLTSMRYSRETKAESSESAWNSYFLYTHSLGEYVLVWILGDNILVRQVRVPDRYAEIASSLATDIADNGWLPGDKEYQRFEAYILALCDFSSGWYILSYRIPDYGGVSFFYGWKPTWGGKFFNIITHERLGTAQDLNSYEYNGAFDKNENYIPSLPISQQNEPFSSITISRVAREWAPRFNRDLVYVPKNVAVSSYWSPLDCSYRGAPSGEDVPIYCFFDAQNNYVTVNYSGGVLPDNPGVMTEEEWKNSIVFSTEDGSYTATPLESYSGAEEGYYSVVTRSEYEDEVRYVSRAVKSQQFKYGGLSSSTYLKQSYTWSRGPLEPCSNYSGDCGSPTVCVEPGQVLGISPLLEGGGKFTAWDTPDPNDPCPCNDWPRTIRIIPLLATVENKWTKVSGALNVINALVIPWGSAESCYILSIEHLGGTFTNTWKTGRYIHANECVNTSQKVYNKLTFAQGGAGGGATNCQTQLPTTQIDGSGVLQSAESTMIFSHVGQFGPGVTTTLTVPSTAPPLQDRYPNGTRYFFENPVCGAGPYDFDGFFSVISGVEGFSYAITEPGRLPECTFAPDFDGPEWDFDNSWHVFAGWQ